MGICQIACRFTNRLLKERGKQAAYSHTDCIFYIKITRLLLLFLRTKILHYLLTILNFFIFLKILWYLTPNIIFSQLEKLNMPTSQSDRYHTSKSDDFIDIMDEIKYGTYSTNW